MADGIVVYADLQLPPEPTTSARLPHPSQGSRVSKRSGWFWIALWFGWTGTIVLLVTVTVLATSRAVYSQGSCLREENVTAVNASKEEAGNQTRNLVECSKKNVSRLKYDLCGMPSEGSECKLCPIKWVSEKGKCYWFSNKKKTWSEAQDSCSRMRAQLVVIQDLEEMKFIKNNIQGEYGLWIGLRFMPQKKNWTWIDGSLLDHTVQLSISSAQNRCGTVVKDKGICSEMCRDEFEWMCEKKAIVIECMPCKGHLP